MTTDYQQNDTAQVCTLNNFCSTVGGTIEVGRQAENGVAAGSSEQTFSVAASQADDNEFSFECIPKANTTGDSGTWTVRVDFTTGHMDATWESCFICRVNSACVNQETIGSATALGLATNTGVRSTNIKLGCLGRRQKNLNRRVPNGSVRHGAGFARADGWPLKPMIGTHQNVVSKR